MARPGLDRWESRDPTGFCPSAQHPPIGKTADNWQVSTWVKCHRHLLISGTKAEACGVTF